MPVTYEIKHSSEQLSYSSSLTFTTANMGHAAGLRAGTRYAFSRGFKDHGMIRLSTYLHQYKYVDKLLFLINLSARYLGTDTDKTTELGILLISRRMVPFRKGRRRSLPYDDEKFYGRLRGRTDLWVHWLTKKQDAPQSLSWKDRSHLQRDEICRRRHHLQTRRQPLHRKAGQCPHRARQPFTIARGIPEPGQNERGKEEKGKG